MKAPLKMVTSAADAARPARRAGVRTRPAWRPLSLRWRAARVPKPAAAGATTVVGGGSWSTTFSPKIELHLRTTIPAAVAYAAAAPAALPASTFREHHTLQHHRTLMHRFTLRESVLRRDTAAPAASHPTAPSTAALRTPLLRAPGVAVHRFPTVETLTRPAAAASMSAPKFVVAAPARRFAVRHQQRPAPPQAAGHRVRAHVDLRAPGQVAAASPVVRPPDLFWRSSASIAPNAAPRNDVRSLFDAARSARTASNESLSLASRPPVPVVPVVAPTAPKFEPAQMERLVDDVIRRVEKHVRVERERRGW